MNGEFRATVTYYLTDFLHFAPFYTVLSIIVLYLIIISENVLAEGEELTANTTDGAYEKHVPVIEQQGDHVTVKVGSVAHPMIEAHYIEWIILETATGYQKHELRPGEVPEASFAVTEPVVAAYEYCNLHGLWKATV